MKVRAVEALLVVFLPTWSSAQYSLVREHSGTTFFDGWNFIDHWDNLTLGNVLYLGQTSATSQNLAFINGAGNAVIKIDNVTDVAPSQNPTRNSIRLESKDMYDVGSLWIFDALHIPYGCSVWPAFWAKGDNWPDGGEIDIVEAINLMERNQVSLHTTDGCAKTDLPGKQLGTTLSKECDTPSGCVTAETKPNSYGKAFADNGGGVWATQFEASGISIWYWPRSDIPESIKSSSGKPFMNLTDWGLPTASYPSTTCNITKYFTPQRLVINIALCGVWAGLQGVYEPTCGGQCTDNVVGPGSPKFDNAYFEIPYVRAYTTGIVTPTATSSVTSASATASDVTMTPSSQSTVSAAYPRANGLTVILSLTVSSLILGAYLCLYPF